MVSTEQSSLLAASQEVMVSTEPSSLLAAKPGGDGFDRTIISLLLRAMPGGDGFDRTVVSGGQARR